MSSFFNSSSNDKILTLTKLKAFADNKFTAAKTMTSVFGRKENTVEKGENAGYQHYLFIQQCFQKLSIPGR